MPVASILGQLPESLRNELIDAFGTIVTNYREGKWEPSELNAGKLCEVVYSILDGYVTGSYPTKSSKPSNMYDACNALTKAPARFTRSVKVHIPRVIISVYEVRNNRGVGHVGGEVDPNHMDATMVLYTAKWMMAELVRLFNNVDTETATASVETLIERELPVIWKVNGKKRILTPGLSMKSKTLLLLYSEPEGLNEVQLLDWLEHSNAAIFRRDILVKGHKARLWEYDKASKIVTLSPAGVKVTEAQLL
jgi:hypothetical protein